MQAEGAYLNPPYSAPQRGSEEPKINNRGGQPPPTLGNRYRWYREPGPPLTRRLGPWRLEP